MTLPNFLVIGAQRAGTTLLHRILAAHPQVFVPFRRKEVHYFDRYADRGVEWYAGFFPPDDEAVRYAERAASHPRAAAELPAGGIVAQSGKSSVFVLSLFGS
jgi:LPS sulfotransferase NodH